MFKLSMIIISVVFVFFCADSVYSGSIEIANHSFEIPSIDPNTNPFMAVPVVPYWIELDVDTDPCCGGRNTGIFLNPDPNSPAGDHIVNADGNQLAFLGSQAGNAILQELTAKYQVGKSYRLEVDICPSLRYPPKTLYPMDTLVLSFYDPNSTDPNDLAFTVVPADEMITNQLTTFSVYLPTVQTEDRWADETIGIGIRAVGMTGAYWDLDNIRLIEYPLVPEFTDDFLVHFSDFARLAAEWLLCIETTGDLTGEGCVDLADLIILTDYWLEDV